MRVAIVHYWLLNQRGGEAVLEALCRMLPGADLFTLFYDPERVSPTIRAQHVRASFLNPLRRWYRSLLPLMPFALEHFDLTGYDLVISSESGPAKGVLAPSGARHVCYCHTPMRYLWDLYPAYLREWTPAWKRPLMAPIANWMRLWDYATAQRVDEFIANSGNVGRRIWRCYRRESQVIHPPVAVESFFHKPADDYFLIVSELVPYKRIDYAVRLFARSGRKLRIVGGGPEYANLKRLARGNVEFCGKVPGAELRELYARCRAFLMPGEEDFGITSVEALASGKAVIALGRGGVLESAPRRDPLGGVFYDEPAESDLEAALARFEEIEPVIDPQQLQQYATRFSEAEFCAKMAHVLGLPGVPSGEHLGESAEQNRGIKPR
jgi:glycosyltransferase involved in cell wall biosynthesis